MSSEVIILGAGPGGLTAAYWLLKNGCKVTIVEKENKVGGLMRPVKFQDFMVDYGFKNLDDGIAEVHQFWKELLKEDYAPIEFRTGILYKGHILEKDKAFKGIRRGMPYSLLLLSLADMLLSKISYKKREISSLADYQYARRGKKFTRIFSQEYSERSRGFRWAQIPSPTQVKEHALLYDFFYDALKSGRKQEVSYHPSKGTGQIIDCLKREIVKMGGQFYLGYSVTNIHHRANQLTTITIQKDKELLNLKSKRVVSSLPLKVVAPLMNLHLTPSENELSFKRGVIMVYLFLNKESSFPHTSLQVSCPNTLMSRITNYGAFGDAMVPKGKACFCVEYFIPYSSKLCSWEDDRIREFALTECKNAGILDPKDYLAAKVIRNLTADTAVSWADYKIDISRRKLYHQLSSFKNLYHINRSGADKSTYAGIMAAKAILNGNKQHFENATQADKPKPWELNESHQQLEAARLVES